MPCAMTQKGTAFHHACYVYVVSGNHKPLVCIKGNAANALGQNVHIGPQEQGQIGVYLHCHCLQPSPLFNAAQKQARV